MSTVFDRIDKRDLFKNLTSFGNRVQKKDMAYDIEFQNGLYGGAKYKDAWIFFGKKTQFNKIAFISTDTVEANELLEYLDIRERIGHNFPPCSDLIYMLDNSVEVEVSVNNTGVIIKVEIYDKLVIEENNRHHAKLAKLNSLADAEGADRIYRELVGEWVFSEDESNRMTLNEKCQSLPTGESGYVFNFYPGRKIIRFINQRRSSCFLATWYYKVPRIESAGWFNLTILANGEITSLDHILRDNKLMRPVLSDPKAKGDHRYYFETYIRSGTTPDDRPLLERCKMGEFGVPIRPPRELNFPPLTAAPTAPANQ